MHIYHKAGDDALPLGQYTSYTNWCNFLDLVFSYPPSQKKKKKNPAKREICARVQLFPNELRMKKNAYE